MKEEQFVEIIRAINNVSEDLREFKKEVKEDIKRLDEKIDTVRDELNNKIDTSVKILRNEIQEKYKSAIGMLGCVEDSVSKVVENHEKRITRIEKSLKVTNI